MTNENLETVKLIVDVAVAGGTGALAFFTYRLARETRRLADESTEGMRQQIGVQMWLEFTKRFDSTDMLKARAALSLRIHTEGMTPPNFLPEVVHNFFEDLGAAYRHGYINKKLAVDTFGYYACRWWEALKLQITRQREHFKDDNLFCDFEGFVKNAKTPADRLNSDELIMFLQSERDLKPKS